MEKSVAAVNHEAEIKEQQQASIPEPNSSAATTVLVSEDTLSGESDPADTQSTLENQQDQELPTNEEESPPTEKVPAIDLEKKRKLEFLFHEVINNPRFWANPNRPERLEQALNLPVYDNKSLQQFYISATDELKAEALDLAVKNKTVPVIPSEEQIKARAEEKYEAKMAKLEKKSKKNAKNAEE